MEKSRAVFQDLIDITLRRMDHDRDGRISFSDFSTTVQVHWKIILIDFHLDCIIYFHDHLRDCPQKQPFLFRMLSNVLRFSRRSLY